PPSDILLPSTTLFRSPECNLPYGQRRVPPGRLLSSYHRQWHNRSRHQYRWNIFESSSFTPDRFSASRSLRYVQSALNTSWSLPADRKSTRLNSSHVKI